MQGKDLVLGQSTGVVNVGDPAEFNMSKVDDFDLNSSAPRNGANPAHMETRNLGGERAGHPTAPGRGKQYRSENWGVLHSRSRICWATRANH